MTTLILIALLPWLLILVCLIPRRGFAILLIWLLLAPAVTHVLRQGEKTILYQTSQTGRLSQEEFYYAASANITIQELFNPTRTLLSLIFFVVVLNAMLRKTPWIPFDKTEKWMTVFSLFLLANVLLLSGRFAFGMRIAIDAFIIPFIGYYLARRYVESEIQWRQLITVIGYMGLFVIVMSFFDRLTQESLFYRVKGPFERHYALYIAMIVIFFATLTQVIINKAGAYGKRTLPAGLSWLIVLLAPVVIVLTLTRGNWVGFIFGLALLLFFGRRVVNVSTTLGVAGSAMIALCFLAVGSEYYLPSELMEDRVANIPNIQGRFATWLAVLQIFGNSPFFGIGLNNLQGELARAQVTFSGVLNYTTAHNSLIALFADLGMIGGGAYVMIQMTMVKRAWRLYRSGRIISERWRGVAVIALMASYHGAGLFEHLIYHPTLSHVYIYVFLGAIAGLQRRHEFAGEGVVKRGRAGKSAAAAASAIR